MVQIHVSSRAAQNTKDYLGEVQTRILSGIRDQLGTEMEVLAQTVADKLNGNPITSHSGRLLAAVLRSPRVIETSDVIVGSVGANEGGLNIGLWLEEGHRFPGQRQKLLERSFKRNIRASLSSERLEQLRSQGGRVKAYPFLVPSLEEREAPIMEHIRQRIADAIE